MKKVLSVLFFFTTITSLLVGCSNKNQNSDFREEKKKLICAIELHSLSNPYYITLKEGAEMFVNSLPKDTAELKVMFSENDDERELKNIKSLIAEGGGDVILFIDSNQASNLSGIAEICEKEGIYWSSVWSTAKGVYPTNYKYYTLFQSQDDEQAGYDIAVEMFDSLKIPGRGKILAIQGRLSNTAAINRYNGLKRALKEYPEIILLDSQSGEWNSEKAFAITENWLTKYREVDGIWCANDDMALAVIKALKSKNLNGKVKVVGINSIDGAVEAIKKGDLLATVSSNGWMQAFFGLAYPYAAYTGKIDTKSMQGEESMIYTPGYLITNDTVDEYEEMFIKNKPKYDYTELGTCVARPMDIEK